MINLPQAKVTGQKPSAALESVQTVLKCRRENRLLNALNRYAREKFSSNKKQTCQKWNLDLHDDSPQLLSFREYSHGKACAKLSECWTSGEMPRNKKFSSSAYRLGASSDEGKVPSYRHKPKFCLSTNGAGINFHGDQKDTDACTKSY